MHGSDAQQALKLPLFISKWPQTNSRLSSKKLTILSTFVEKLDQLSTVVLFLKKSQLLQLVNCRLFVDFAVDFSVGKWKNSYKMASKSSKNSVKVNSRLRGRSSQLQQLTFFLKLDQLSTGGRLSKKESNDCRLLKKKSLQKSTVVLQCLRPNQ